MMLKIGEWEFDHAEYDPESDTLYLSVGPRRRARGDQTPEGHVLLYDDKTGEVCGLTLVDIGQRAAWEVWTGKRERQIRWGLEYSRNRHGQRRADSGPDEWSQSVSAADWFAFAEEWGAR